MNSPLVSKLEQEPIPLLLSHTPSENCREHVRPLRAGFRANPDSPSFPRKRESRSERGLDSRFRGSDEKSNLHFVNFSLGKEHSDPFPNERARDPNSRRGPHPLSNDFDFREIRDSMINGSAPPSRDLHSYGTHRFPNTQPDPAPGTRHLRPIWRSSRHRASERPVAKVPRVL